MSDRPSLREHLHPILVRIDQGLALSRVDVAQRPFHATVLVIRHVVIAVDFGGKQASPPDSLDQLLEEEWAAALYTEVWRWYEARYGARMRDQEANLSGFVLINGTPFSIRVPSTTSRPGVPGITAWLTFLGEVQEDEDALLWIEHPPEISSIDLRDRTTIRTLASRLRSINVRLLGIPQTDEVVAGLVGGIPAHLEVAASLPLRPSRDSSLGSGLWELQMACERAFKLLLQLKTGSFMETHDLFVLYDQVVVYGVQLPRATLRRLPRWQNVVDLRYGQSTMPSPVEYFDSYRAALEIIDAVLEPAATVHLAGSSIELKAPHWYRLLWESQDRQAG